jgi:hypothetical protein
VAGVGQPVDELVESDAIVVRVQYVICLDPVFDSCAQRGDRLSDEIDWQPVIVRPLSLAVRIELVERAGRDSGDHQAQNQPGKHIRHIELTGIAGVGQNHVAAEHRDGQPAQMVGLAQQNLAGPLAVVVTVGVTVV